MKTKIFVDTLFIIALINKRDQYHQKALQCAKQYQNYPLIITDVIFLEVGNNLSIDILPPTNQRLCRGILTSTTQLIS